MNVLVADDDPASRLITQRALQRLGHHCETAIDGHDAWETFTSTIPEVVISDWLMPGMTGLELCRNIRAHTPDGYTYFIMVTGQRALVEILAGMRAGADDYLIKPLDPDALQARLIPAARVTALHRQLSAQRSELQGLNDELVAIARRDPLTKLRNRRALDEDLELLDARGARYGYHYCVALLDIDHFKSYNDTYGHQAGDAILAAVAAALESAARSGDALYRYGGEEFLCILPEQSLECGTLAVARMQSAVARLELAHTENPGGLLTLSAGLAALDARHSGPASAALKEADDALYRAKQLGRNRIEHAVAQPA